MTQKTSCRGQVPRLRTGQIWASVARQPSSAATRTASTPDTSTNRTGDLNSRHGCRNHRRSTGRRVCSITRRDLLITRLRRTTRNKRQCMVRRLPCHPMPDILPILRDRYLHPQSRKMRHPTDVVQYPPGGSPVVYAPQAQMPSNTPPHGWQPAYNTPVPYPPQGPPPPGPPQAPNQSPGPTHGPGGIPYPFGQLPANVNPHDPKSQHPIPGSYNRNHAFNPKTQSFSPGVPMPPVHAPQPPFTAPGSHHSSPQIGTPPHLAYTGHQPQMHPPPYGGAYGMARQGSNNSIPSYHGPPHGTPPHVAMQPPQHLVQQPPMPVNSRPPPHGPGPNGQMYSHLPTYGNPATLPQKPNAGI